MVSSEAMAISRDQDILARIVEYDQIGVKPELVMEAPIPASKKVLKKAGLAINDIDLVEHNEAYSTASVVIQRELGIPDNKFNVNGGAIALGHPIGCTGAALVAKMTYALRNRRLHRGLVTLCLGGGEAVAMILEV
jgi:acetyl-CoA C-acetyltransferase